MGDGKVVESSNLLIAKVEPASEIRTFPRVGRSIYAFPETVPPSNFLRHPAGGVTYGPAPFEWTILWKYL